MLTLSDLPRKDGVVDGNYVAVHSSDSFSLFGYGFKFEAGRTVEPVSGRTALRLGSAYGSAITFIPADRETANKVVDRIVDFKIEYGDALLKELAVLKFPGEAAPAAHAPAPVATAAPSPVPTPASEADAHVSNKTKDKEKEKAKK